MKSKPGFSLLFSKSEGINVLSLARFFLFGARDVCQAALPVFLEASLGWSFWEIGGSGPLGDRLRHRSGDQRPV